MPIMRRVGCVVLALGIVAGCASHPGPPAGSADPAKADTVMRVVRDFMAQAHLKAVIVRVTADGKEIEMSPDDRLSKWLPDFPHSQRNDAFDNLFYANPFRQWTAQDILAQISSRPMLYDPGTNWNYAHTNYVLLGLALEKAIGQDIPTLPQNEVLVRWA